MRYVEPPPGYREPQWISGKFIARKLNLRAATVSYWVTKGMLPPDLQPEWVMHDEDPDSEPSPIWYKKQLPGIVKWHKKLHEKKEPWTGVKA